MDTQELRDCNDERLAEIEKSLRRQIFDARIKNFTNQLDDTASIRRARRDLARVKTILSERSGSFIEKAEGASPSSERGRLVAEELAAEEMAEAPAAEEKSDD